MRTPSPLVAFLGACLGGVCPPTPAAGIDVPVVQVYSAPTSQDQDDMCIWVHPTDVTSSTVITSDKASGSVYVYDLSGAMLQSIATGQPGNVDIRYGIELGGECVDLVAFNERSEHTIRVYRVNAASRFLERVDDGTIVTGSNYGFTLYRHADGTLYGITGPSSGALHQYRLFDDGTGRVTGTETAWVFTPSTVEGMVGDDETGFLYLGQETAGIWKVDAMNAANATLIASVGDSSGLQADVEGLTIYHAAGGGGYILASSQGAGRFTVFERQPPHLPIGNFSLAGVGQTDGIDVCNLSLGAAFPQGLFTCHNGAVCCPVVAARWEDVASALGGALIDTESWDPRRRCGPTSDVRVPAPGASSLSASPNPFNPTTRIRFRTDEPGPVHLAVYDTGGRQVRLLADAVLEAGEHALDFDAQDQAGRRLPSGIYVVQLDAGGAPRTLKLVLSK